MRSFFIDASSPYLDAVNRLGDENAATLGFLPYSAYQDYAKKKRILVAISENEELAGYVLFWIRYNQEVLIRHLCVAEKYRGQGVARSLVDALREETHHLRGIGLWCRRDYEAHAFWPVLGFRAISNRRGRGKNPTVLTFWWLDNGHRTLFDELTEKRLADKLAVVIDVNIFRDLDFEDIKRTHTEESRGLYADFLQMEIELCVTDELWNEIDRLPEPERNHHKKRADGFVRVNSDNAIFNSCVQQLRNTFPAQLDESDWSDLRQLAKTIAADVQFFVTRDNDLLEMAPDVYDEYGLSIIRPSDLIVQIDELRGGADYQPARFAGVTLIQKRKAKESEGLESYFQRGEMQESKSEFLHMIRRFLSAPHDYATNIIDVLSGTPLALFVTNVQRDSVLHIPMLRLARYEGKPTLVRHLVLHLVQIAIEAQLSWIKISEPYLEPLVEDVLREAGYISTANGWQRGVFRSGIIHEIIKSLSEVDFDEELANHYSEIATILELGASQGMLVAIEKRLWPAKLLDAQIPTFTIPIRPLWASELFDESLANRRLFGPDRDLALNWEGVYYRANAPTKLSSPGRILWYVSSDNVYGNIQSIRACSYLDEVVVGLPKDLYRQYKRLGVYKWSHLFNLVDQDISKEVMALRFSFTEQFTNPVAYNALVHLRKEMVGLNPQVQSPALITREMFEEIYVRGISKN